MTNMLEVSINDLVGQKVLAYDIFDADSAKIFSAGEIMTPGKIMVIRNYEVLYKQNDDIDDSLLKKTSKKEDTTSTSKGSQVEVTSKKEPPKEKPILVNTHSIIEAKAQVELTTNFRKVSLALATEDYENTKAKLTSLRDELIEAISGGNKDVKFCSELKLVGDKIDSHSLNTAIFSVFLAKKLDFSDNEVSELALGALLHDIGKTKIPQEVTSNPQASRKQKLLYESHTIHGYKIIKNAMKLPTTVARVALEHHETMDGNGWPYGISNNMISDFAQIVAVANYFDNITSTLGSSEAMKFSEAMKKLLKKSSKTFAPRPLYTFVHMFSYSDTLSIKDLIG